MQRITEIALEEAATGVFTRVEVACWVGGSPDRQHGLLKRAVKAGEVVRIHRGLYCLAARYQRPKIDPLVVAQRIYGPSYISLETALSYHGWIPEAVYTITSVSQNRSREFETPLGHFSFARTPQKTLYVGVTRVVTDAGSFLLASPLKALADYVYVHRRDWISAEPIIKSLRVDANMLAIIRGDAIERHEQNYSSPRVRRFLAGLWKDLKL